MSWTDVDLTSVSTTLEPVGEGAYTFQLLPGAKFSENDPNRIEATAAITDGEFAGRRLFFSYPNPAEYDWSPRVVKRMLNALGVDAVAGENPVQALNRAAGLRFTANVSHRKDKATGAKVEPIRADLDIFSVGAAA
jgi:hypothetical protein